MHWIWWVVIGIVLFLLILPIATLKIKIKYYHDQDNDELEVKASIFRFLSYTLKVPVLKIDDNSPSIIIKEEQHSALGDTNRTDKVTPEIIKRDIRKVLDFLEHVIGFHKILSNFLSRVVIHEFNWNSKVGIGDAVATGMLVGALWGIKGSAVGLVSNYMKLTVIPNLQIEPVFQRSLSHTELSCMISFRLGHAILAGLKIMRHWKKRPSF